MKYLNVFATKEEIDLLKAALKIPYIIVGGQTSESPQKIAHRLALKHNLPEIPGYYGCDLTTGEFISD